MAGDGPTDELPTQAGASRRRGSLLAIFLTVFVDLLGFGVVLPLLPLYAKHFAEERDWTKGQTTLVIALLMASFSAMQFLFSPFWGKLSDRFGRRPIIMIGLVGSTVCYALFGVSAAMGSIVGLFISRIGAGISGATISTAQAYIADSTEKKNRAKGMALIGAAFALGFTVGPLIGAAAVFFGGELTFTPWPGYIASALSGVALLTAYFLLPESRVPDAQSERHQSGGWASLGRALRIPSVGLLLACVFIGVFAFANFESTLSLEIAQITPLERFEAWMRSLGLTDPDEIKLATVCATFAFVGIVLTFAQGVLVRRLAGKLSEAVMATSGSILAILGYGVLAWAASRGDLKLLLVGIAVEIVGFSLVSPSLQSLLSRRTPADRQGEVLGLSQSAASLARIAGPVGVGLFAQSPALPYVAAAGLMTLCLLLVVLAVRSGSDATGEPPASSME